MPSKTNKGVEDFFITKPGFTLMMEGKNPKIFNTELKNEKPSQ